MVGRELGRLGWRGFVSVVIFGGGGVDGVERREGAVRQLRLGIDHAQRIGVRGDGLDLGVRAAATTPPATTAPAAASALRLCVVITVAVGVRGLLVAGGVRRRVIGVELHGLRDIAVGLLAPPTPAAATPAAIVVLAAVAVLLGRGRGGDRLTRFRLFARRVGFQRLDLGVRRDQLRGGL